jgi:argininosuccinate lyase
MTYMIVGKAVDQAIQDQKRIDEIDVSLLTRLTQEEAGVSLTLTQDQLRNILDPVQCVSRRQHIGGASAEQMAILLHHRLELVGKHSAWLASERERIQWARQECASFTEGTTEEVGH